jgi:ferric-dicitrate binding protein FerR (iron transport regulator)
MDPDRLLRYLTGHVSADEAAEIGAWIDADPRHAEQMRVVAEAWRRTVGLPETDAADVEASWTRIAARTTERGADRTLIPIEPRLATRHADATPSTRTAHDTRATRTPRTTRAPARGSVASPARRTGHGRRKALRWAAMVALLIGGASFWTLGDRLLPEPTLQRFATDAGQRVTLTLAGGTTVLLGPESELRFPDRWSSAWPWTRGRVREVHLNGVGYFDVAHDARRPFVVHAAGAETRVLGTRFVVRAYADDEAVDVGVAEGRVALRSSDAERGAEVLLGERERGRVPVGSAARRLEGNAEALLAWVDGRLAFRDTPVRAVVREMERWYDVDIALGESGLDRGLAERRVTISFDGEPFAEAITLLAAALETRVEREGRSAVLTSETREDR